MSWLRDHFRDRGPRRGPSSETEAMKRQNSAQEHEIIELQEQNVEESETDRGKPLNAQMRKVGISFGHLILPVGDIFPKYYTAREMTLEGAFCRGDLICCFR